MQEYNHSGGGLVESAMGCFCPGAEHVLRGRCSLPDMLRCARSGAGMGLRASGFPVLCFRLVLFFPHGILSRWHLGEVAQSYRVAILPLMVLDRRTRIFAARVARSPSISNFPLLKRRNPWMLSNLTFACGTWYTSVLLYFFLRNHHIYPIQLVCTLTLHFILLYCLSLFLLLCCNPWSHFDLELLIL